MQASIGFSSPRNGATRIWRLVSFPLVLLLMMTWIDFPAISSELLASEDTASLQGSWRARSYQLKDGTKHSVDGLIFFSEKDWMVVFFVLDGSSPKRGSGEGGRYEVTGEKLTFFHQYHLSQGEALEGLPEAPLRMEVREASKAPDEPCTIRLEGEDLALHFPSGNSMFFSRSSN